ncbi:MAG: 50S ribosomal protein L1, partial [Candidatus Aenigmatarchaeota archaeon]
MVEDKIIESIKKAREAAPKRNFKQTFDLAVNLKNIDLKKPENKVKTEVLLPSGTGKIHKIGIIADNLIPKAQKLDNIILIHKDELERLGRNKREAKRIASECVAFIAEAPLMPAIGKALGPVLAPRGLMPKPVPPTLPDLKPLVDRAASTVRLALKDSPVFHCAVGNEDMSDE